MENAIRRMEMLVNDLLSTSFIEMGKFSLYKKNSDLGALCRSLVEEFILGTNPPPDIEVDIPTEAIMVDFDSNRIGQVVMNLLSNARKYSPPDSLIGVSLKENADSWVISVRDSGIGIAPERLPHIFDRFYRVPNTEVLRGSSVGLGLGLYISKEIVERHGGHIEVISEVGKGSVFSIFLPSLVETTEYALRAQLARQASSDMKKS
jgi:two-component system sensor histidine kinase/response regulator